MPTRSGRAFSTPGKGGAAPTANAVTRDGTGANPTRWRLKPLALHAKPPLAAGIYKGPALERLYPGRFALMKQEYIERGYRFRLTVKQCVYSLFQLHNEVRAFCLARPHEAVASRPLSLLHLRRPGPVPFAQAHAPTAPSSH